MMEDKTLTTAELAKYLKVSRQVIDKLAQEKMIPFFWIGNRRRFVKKDIIKALYRKSNN